MEVHRMKCVFVGDKAGKTSLIITYNKKEFPSEFVPTTDWALIDTTVDDTAIELAFWDTVGSDEYERLRPLQYPEANVLLLCISVVVPSSMSRIKEKFVLEITHHCPNRPFLLVGTKTDLRDDKEIVDKLAEDGQHPITAEEGDALAKEIGAVKYMECSALKQIGTEELFDQVMRTSLENPLPKRKTKRKCTLF